MTKEFIHYHNHSEYSSLDAVSKVKDMAKKALELKHKAVGLTDHGTMSGLLAFNAACLSVDVKPILGIEFYVTPYGTSRHDRIAYARQTVGDISERQRNNYHLIALATSLDGFNNLCRLTTLSYLEGKYIRPRIDFELLNNYKDGLVITSACLAGEVNHWLRVGNEKKALEVASALNDIFGENFYLELMYSDLEEQKEIIPGVKKIAKKLGRKITVANDSHFVNYEDSVVQDYSLLVMQGQTVHSQNGLRMGDQYYMKDYDEMLRAVNEPEGLKSTMEIAEKCEVSFKLGDPKIPTYNITTDSLYNEYKQELEENKKR